MIDEKIKIVVVGNCQARPIATLLSAANSNITITKVAVVHLLNSNQESEFSPYFDEADIIISQLISNQYPCNFVRTGVLEEKFGAKLLKIVNLFSFSHTPYLQNLPKDLRTLDTPFGDYHFPVVIKSWEEGRSKEETVQALEEEFFSIKDRTYRVEETSLREKESQADVCISDFIEQQSERVFHTFNHPKNVLLHEYVNRIIEKLKIPNASRNLKEKNEFLGQFTPFMLVNGEIFHRRIRNGVTENISTKRLVDEFFDFYDNHLESSQPIPRKIIQFWNNQPPSDIRNLTISWKEKNPTFQYELFSYDTALNFLLDNYDEDVVRLFKKANVPAMQSDIFRVAYILSQGGVYVDAATECQCSLEELVEDNRHLTVMRKWHGGIANGFILAPPNHPTLNVIWKKILKNLEEEKINDIWKATGPHLFNETCEKNSSVKIIEQEKAKRFFTLKNDLEHKKEQHWSQVQNNKSIYTKQSNITKVILHLGPHKTGTTSFQNLLELNEDVFNSAGIGIITVRSSTSREYKKLRNDYTRLIQGSLLKKSYDENELVTSLKGILEAIIDLGESEKNSTVFISDENLLGPVVGHYFANRKGRETSFYSLSKIIFRAIEEIASKEIKVVIVDRGYESIVQSSYKDFIVKLQDSESIEEFQSNINKSASMGYDSFFENAKTIFSNNLNVFKFDFFCSHMTDIIHQLTGLRIREPLGKAANSSLKPRALEIALKVIPLLENESERTHFRAFLNKLK